MAGWPGWHFSAHKQQQIRHHNYTTNNRMRVMICYYTTHITT